MTTAADGVISVSYRPLMTMDELHALLLSAVFEEGGDPLLLEQVFSLPNNVVSKELAALEGYGLVQRVGGMWKATRRGRQVIAVRATFCDRAEVEVRATGRQWLLGPGDFSVDEMVRDMVEIETLARDFGISNSGFAVKFLDDRRKAARGIEEFVLGWPSRDWGGAKHGPFGEALVLGSLSLAETEGALRRLEELLASRVNEVVKQLTASEADRGDDNRDEKVVDATSVRIRGQEAMKQFENARRGQRRQNQHLARIRMICEAMLVRQWVSASIASLCATYDSEPAAFTFRSTVPFVEPSVPIIQTSPSRPNSTPAAKAKQNEEGFVRKFFRWLFE